MPIRESPGLPGVCKARTAQLVEVPHPSLKAGSLRSSAGGLAGSSLGGGGDRTASQAVTIDTRACGACPLLFPPLRKMSITPVSGFNPGTPVAQGETATDVDRTRAVPFLPQCVAHSRTVGWGVCMRGYGCGLTAEFRNPRTCP
eukprot:gene10037-biopygen3266